MSAMMMEKIMVVAPTTAVPISTGLAVALKVLPAPSFSSSRSLARPKLASMLKSLLQFLAECRESARSAKARNTDCALSVTGP